MSRNSFCAAEPGENPIKKIDLLDTLVPVSWQSLTNSGKAYKTDYTARGGDHIFCLVPDPYFEAEENAYIQQMTKVIINVGGIPGAWMEPAGLSAEIVPLCKPYDRWTGNVFQGKVLYNGKPVPGAEVEVEYLNHDLLTDHNVFAKTPAVKAPRVPLNCKPFLPMTTVFSPSAFPRPGGGDLQHWVWTRKPPIKANPAPKMPSSGSRPWTCNRSDLT